MDLIGEQYERLEKSLLDAFPDKDKLKRMFRIVFNDKLQTVAEGENHTERIDQLIDWAEEKGKVVELIRGAHRRNPTNQALKDFCDTIRQDLLKDSGSRNLSELSAENVHSFIELDLVTLPSETLFAAAQMALPQGANDDKSDKDLVDFTNTKLCPVIRFYCFLQLALTKFPQSKKIPTLLMFACELSQSIVGSSSPTSQKLTEWIQKVKSQFNMPLPTTLEPQNTLIKKGTLEVALMVTVRLYSKQQQGKSLRYQIDGYLYFDQLQGSTPPCVQPRPPLPLSLPDHQTEPNVVCTWKEVPKFTDQFFQVAIDHLNHQLKQELGYRAYQLTVEMFLPMEHMGAAVDQWPRFPRQEPLGKDYGVIVRFCDRLDNDERYNEICLAWERLQAVLQTSNGDDFLSQHFEDTADFSQYRSWRQLEVILKQKLGLKICCGLPESNTDKKSLFEAILFGDVPIAIWTRCADIVEPESDSGEVKQLDISEALTLLLAMEGFHNPLMLLEKLKNIRLQAWPEDSEETRDRCLGHHVSFMLDNPDRIPLLPPLAVS